MIGGFVKCSLCLFLALLKPIIEIPKIISLSALFEIVKIIAEFAVILRCTVFVVLDLVLEVLRLSGRDVRLVGVVFVLGFHGRSVYRGSWRPFFRQWYAGKAPKRNPSHVPWLLRSGGSGTLRTTSGSASAARIWWAWVPGTSP